MIVKNKNNNIHVQIQTLFNDAPSIHDVCSLVGSAGGLPHQPGSGDHPKSTYSQFNGHRLYGFAPGGLLGERFFPAQKVLAGLNFVHGDMLLWAATT